MSLAADKVGDRNARVFIELLSARLLNLFELIVSVYERVAMITVLSQLMQHRCKSCYT